MCERTWDRLQDSCPTSSPALPVDPSSSSMDSNSDSSRGSNDQNSDENSEDTHKKIIQGPYLDSSHWTNEHFGRKDRYGCIPSAGYSWCKANKKCQNGEHPCPTSSALPVVGRVDQYGCMASAGFSWCNANKKCQRSWKHPCPTSSALPERQEARANQSAQPTENAIIKDDIMLEQDKLGVVPDWKEFMPGYFCPPEFPACWRPHRREELQG